MINSFNNFKVGTKILIGYIIALALMAIVIIVAILRLQQINNTVTELAESLAAEQHLADQVVANVWATHFYALQYMDQQNPADLERYRTEYANFDQLLTLADQRILKQERLAHLDDIKSGVQTYGDDFNEVIELLNTRDRHLLVALDQQGRLAEIKLEQIRANSFFADDADTSYQAGNAQRALLLMRVAAFQYLESGDPYWVDEFNRWNENAQASFQKLDETIQSPIYGTMSEDAQSAVNTYAQSFTDIQGNYSQQQQIVAERLNVFGPVIRAAGAAISTDVATDFQMAAATTHAQAAQTQWLLLSTMGLAILAALGSGYVISRSITTPLEKVTEVARQIANLDLRMLTSEMDAISQGDLTRHLTITTRALSIRSGDEIGQMARAFNAIIRQVRKAGIAFSDMAANLRNLTERNDRLFEETQTARQVAEAASQAKSNFLASMSHELRTPLNAILGYTQILRRNQTLPPAQSEGLAVIEESGQHLLTLINDILELAKIETGKLWLQPTPVHLPIFLDSVVGMMQLRAKEKGLIFHDSRGPNLPAGVEVDEKRLRQVLINLLSNAINFTSAGSINMRTQIVKNGDLKSPNGHNHQPTKRIRFIVSDTGIGIDPAHFERIFQPFEQLDPESPAVEGTGLGLPICQQLVQAMGSEIQIESKEGAGSTLWFDLMLPIIEIELPATQKSTSQIIGYIGRRRKLLLVDDKPNNLSLLSDFLQSLDFEIFTSQNGQEAIKKAGQIGPDLIILDLLMPDTSGIETIQEVRRNQDKKKTIIIGTLAGHNKHGTGENGFDDFLPKPIDFDILIAMLGHNLDLTWQYEPEILQPIQLITTVSTAEATQLTPPSAQELHDLFDLAMKGNMPGIYKRAVEIEQDNQRYQPFAKNLKSLAKAYDEERVLTFLKPFLDNDL